MYLSTRLFCGQIKPNQLIELDGKPVIVLSIRNTYEYPIKSSTRRKNPNVERSSYLLTVKNYFDNRIYSVYDRTIKDHKLIGIFDHIKLKLKKVFSG